MKTRMHNFFTHEMNPMVTITPYTDTPWLDKHMEHARNYKHKKKHDTCRKEPFNVNPAWNRCFGGRSDYENIY